MSLPHWLAQGTLCFATVLIVGCGGVPRSQPPVDILVEKEVSDLKVGLRSPNSAKPLRLYERMEDLGTSVVSIALVNEGELRWARSFGGTSVAPEPKADDAEDSKSGVFPTPLAGSAVTEASAAVDVGDLIDIPRALLAIRAGDDESTSDKRLSVEIFAPLEMSHSRVADGKLCSTAEDLAKIVTDLQKAHAGKPARRLRQEQAQALFGTLREATETPPADLGLDIEGEGQAIHFERRATTDTHLIVLAGFVYSGHGAVVIVDNPDAGTLVQEILAGLAELYDWPAYRAESEDSPTPVQE